MTAEPDDELKLCNHVNKRVLHIHYAENKVQHKIKNQQDFKEISPETIFFLDKSP